MTAFASGEGGRHLLTYAAETTFGTTPSTPTMLTLRCTSFDLNPTKTATPSEELGKGTIMNVRHGAQRCAGNMGIELSYGTFDALLAALLRSTWSSDVLIAGTTFQPFTFESKYTAVAAEYEIFRGVIIDSLSLSFSPEKPVTGSFGLLAASLETAAATLDAEPTAASTTEAFVFSEGTMSEGDAEVFHISGLELNIANNAELGLVLGSSTAQTWSRGLLNITGTITGYCADDTLIDKFLNETESAITLALTDPATNALTIDLSSVIYTGATKTIGPGPIIHSLPFQAIYNATDTSPIVLTRDAA